MSDIHKTIAGRVLGTLCLELVIAWLVLEMSDPSGFWPSMLFMNLVFASAVLLGPE